MRCIRTITLSVLVLWFLGACAERPTAPVSDRTGKRPAAHVVKRGETLYSIAFVYGVHYQDLARWNHIRPPYRIHPGQRLSLHPHRAAQRPRTQQPNRSPPPRSSTTPHPRPVPRPAPDASTPRWNWPAQGALIHGFPTNGAGKKGIGIAGKKGQPVLAAAAGKVVYTGSGLVRYGKLIIIKHNRTYFSAYAHNERLLVKEGQSVKAGQRIATMGSSGAQRVMLHFEIRKNGKPVNPLGYLPRR